MTKAMALNLQYRRGGRGVFMARTTVAILAAAFLAASTQSVDAQGRRNQQNQGERQEVARSQGVPPGQLPPADLCRVWYDNRSNGRQPAATNCRQAEAIASRDRNARVIYGENVYYGAGRGYGSGGYPGVYDDDRGVRRDGRVRDPRISGGTIDDQYGRTIDPYGRNSRYGNTAGYQNGYRDGLTKGREDGEDNDRYDANRHSWYKSATRGYDDDYGSRSEYQARYREGFDAGYSEGYRIYGRR